jgi:hypothetical protein
MTDQKRTGEAEPAADLPCAHEWALVEFSYATWVECVLCGTRGYPSGDCPITVGSR